jgi:hypothetical protein
MKTPMQEVFAHLRASKEDDSLGAGAQDKFYRTGLRNAIKYAESMLEKEKEVMESAWQDGMYECDGDGTFEDFYKTFNTKEKMTPKDEATEMLRASLLERVNQLSDDEIISLYDNLSKFLNKKEK